MSSRWSICGTEFKKTQNTQQNPWQIPDFSYAEIFSGQVQPTSIGRIATKILWFFSIEQAQAENERLGLQQQRGIESANQLLRKEELKRNQFLQQLNQLVTEIQPNEISPKNLKWNLQHQKGNTITSCKIWIFLSYTIRLSCHYRKTKTIVYYG